MANIRVPVERLREVSHTLEHHRQELDNLLQRAMSLVQNMQGEWRGLAQVDYAHLFEERVPPMHARTNEMLEQFARELKRIADTFEEVDDQVVSPSGAGVAVGAAAAAAGIAGAVGISGSTSGSTGGAGSGGETGGKAPGHASPPQEAYQPRYDGSKPAPGMDSTYGKPGQLPLDAPIKSDVNNRSAGRYQDVINQFAVGNNPRYNADGSYTYCNTFAGDVARAMGAPLPQKREFGMNPQDQATIGFPQMWQYFTDPNAPVTAASDGWRQVNDVSVIKDHVNSGKMAVAVNNGHIAVIQPGQGESVSNLNSLAIAQAGATNSNNLTLAEGFGSSPTPQFFIID